CGVPAARLWRPGGWPPDPGASRCADLRAFGTTKRAAGLRAFGTTSREGGNEMLKLDLDDIQGLIARGYRTLPYARCTIFAAHDAAAGHALLSWLLPRVTPAGGFAADSALHLAYTAAGLRRLGLAESVIAGFSPQFIGGMTGPNRSRFLGDVGESDPHHWAWGGPHDPPIDGLILLYADSPEVLDPRPAGLARCLDGLAIRQVTVLDTLELGDNEPFGFHDGISQPIIQG